MMWWTNGANMGWAGWIGMTVMMLVWVAIVVAVIWGIVAFVRRTGTPYGYGSGEGPYSRDADAILDARFARGEIDAEEYEQRRKTLHAAH